MRFRTVAIARGKDKELLARQLGAAHYIDSQSADPAAELTKLGGAKVVLATVTHGPAMSATVGGLAPRGRLMVLGAAESLDPRSRPEPTHSHPPARAVAAAVTAASAPPPRACAARAAGASCGPSTSMRS